MGYPFGKAPAEDGTGTTPADLQRIIGAQFSTSGILPSGGVQVTGTSAMAYRVSAGAVVLKTPSGLGLLYPVEEQTVPTQPAPAAGSRTDRVIMDQSGAIRVIQGAAPAGGITLGLFTVSAGVTATSAAVQSQDRNFAIPAGGSLGRLAHWRDPGGGAMGAARKLRASQRFVVPSDRIVRVDMTVVMRIASTQTGSTGLTNVFAVIDNAQVFERALSINLSRNWETFSGSWSVTLREGAHTFEVWTHSQSGALPEMATSIASQSEAAVWDIGVAG